MRTRNRATVAALAVTTAAALGLSACGGGSSSAESSASGGGSATNLKWTMWVSSTADQEAWQSIADKVSAADSSLSVTLQGSPWTDYWTKIGSQLSASDSPCIVSMQSMRLRGYQDGLVDLSDYLTDADTEGFDEVALDAMKLDGDLYALPYDTGPAVLFYNADMFADAGIEDPGAEMSVEEFEDAGAKLAAKGETLLGGTVEDVFLESLVLSYNGGQAVSEDGTIDPTNSDFVAGVQWLADLVSKGYASEADGADTSADDNAFISGTVATQVNGPWSIIDLAGKADFTMGVTTLPGSGATYSSGSGFAVSKNCENIDAAVDAIKVMTGSDALDELASSGRAFAARTDSQELWYQKATNVSNVQDTLKKAQELATPEPGSTLTTQFNTLLAQYAAPAVNGETDVTEAFNEIASQLN